MLTCYFPTFSPIIEIFGTIDPNEIQTVITFDFVLCNNSSICDPIDNTRGLTIVQLKGSGNNSFPFKAFLSDKNVYTLIEDKGLMPFGWPPNGTDIRESNIFAKLPEMPKDEWIYYTAVFSPVSNAMIVVMRGPEERDKVMVRQLNSKWLWDDWRPLSNVRFDGLFVSNGTMFGIIGFENLIVEFKPDLTYTERVSPFRGCPHL